ncbi:MAG: ATP-binding protein [Candidatus Nitrohelix vancouverensis]|uniref:ATP-binding protein n=1 Tax=Candidatus Nitrohelix vancouverensis TaxID=2705534 RepID=A0A7T0C5C2_9BACT|nr:MAG: ATP-binding protein [Candidatus Nitrohelix vancouverensis]
MRAEVCACLVCDKCDGTGRLFYEDDQGRSFVKNCECLNFRRRVDLLSRAGLPSKYAKVELETYHPFDSSQKKALSRARDFLADFKKGGSDFNHGLVFMGGPGVGKTHLCVAIVKSLILDLGVSCKFVDFFQLFGEIRQGYSEDRAEKSLIEPLIQSRVLVIDELAKGRRHSEWEQSILDEFISARYNAGNKVTLYTTNYLNQLPNGKKSKKDDQQDRVDFREREFQQSFSKETLLDRVGERIYSRITESSDFIEIKGEDFRQGMQGSSRRIRK